MDQSNFLIDFSSPAHKNDLALPLIPIPPQMTLAPKALDEPFADPFEMQEVAAPDPFECVLQAAANNSISEQTAAKESDVSLNIKDELIKSPKNGENTNSVKSPDVKHNDKLVEPVFSFPPNIELNKTSIANHEATSRNEIPNDNKVPENIQGNNVIPKSAQDLTKDSSKLSVAIESDSKSHISTDFSTEESLKEVIAKRVNRCIQDTLNGSVKNSMFNKQQNKRSLSFIGLSSAPNKEFDRLNKSCTDAINTTNLDDQNIDASSDNSGFGILSPNSTEVSLESNVEDKVFKEAHKLSRTFSKLAESFRRDQESDSDSEDLFSCKPRWYADSSEDEEEKLRKDPTLNFRRRSDGVTCSSPAPAPSTRVLSDSPALLAYKSRRSLTHVQTELDYTQEEVTMKRSVSMGSHLKEVTVIPPLVAAGPINIMKNEAQPIKLRKKFGGDTKKGPLKAVMPVQNMTKEPFSMSGKLSKKDSSPETRMPRSSAHALRTPVKDNSQLNITPMASSTPNKAEIFGDSKINDSLSTATNKRHSLEGSFANHKSRGVLPEAGARPRSNSASSSIPRVMQVKPLRGLAQAPKSTSNLSSTQMTANKVTEKKKTSQPKSSINSRVLADVKTKSPRQSKVRTAVNTLSNLVKGKKTAARDKENRVPH